MCVQASVGGLSYMRATKPQYYRRAAVVRACACKHAVACKGMRTKVGGQAEKERNEASMVAGEHQRRNGACYRLC